MILKECKVFGSSPSMFSYYKYHNILWYEPCKYARCDAFLLLRISFWDNERERIAALTQNDLFLIKYDFIALKVLNHYRIPLRNIDTLTVGDLVYPSGSLAPLVLITIFFNPIFRIVLSPLKLSGSKLHMKLESS